MSNERERMLESLDRREKVLKDLFTFVRNEVTSGRYDGTHPAREWLAQFCNGVGLNMCAGEFQIGNSIGVNTDPRALATDHWAFADRMIADMVPLDYIITNYLECFSDPLRVLQDWRGLMKVGGVLAIVARNSDEYDDDDGWLGPLKNHRRSSCFNMKTLCFYLERAGFEVYRRELFGKEMRVAARRR